MANGAQSDEVQFGIVTKLASEADVVHLKIGNTATVLAAPAIALEYPAPEFPIGYWAEFEPRSLGARSNHEALLTCSRNSTFCAHGRNSMSRFREKSRLLGFPCSRLAPARKSAQIISKQ
jgi:hypothetical protein